MKVGKVLLLSLVGGAAIAMVTVIGLRPHRGERRATVAKTAEKTAEWSATVDRSDPPDPHSAGAHSIAESPAERERTLQAGRSNRLSLTTRRHLGGFGDGRSPLAAVRAQANHSNHGDGRATHQGRRKHLRMNLRDLTLRALASIYSESCRESKSLLHDCANDGDALSRKQSFDSLPVVRRLITTKQDTSTRALVGDHYGRAICQVARRPTRATANRSPRIR